MKTNNAIALLIICCFSSLQAQDTIQKIKIYKTWVYLNYPPFQNKGVLYEINDSSILVSKSLVVKDYYSGEIEYLKFNITDIRTIQTRRKNSLLKGILIGAATGFGIGYLLGHSLGDDPPCPPVSSIWEIFDCNQMTAHDKGMVRGAPLMVGGAGLGALIGSIKVKIPINGNYDTYNKKKTKLRGYSINKK